MAKMTNELMNVVHMTIKSIRQQKFRKNQKQQITSKLNTNANYIVKNFCNIEYRNWV